MCQWLCKFVEASKKIQKHQARRLFRARSIHLCYQTPNPARETVPLGTVFNLTFKSVFSIHIKTIEISTIRPVLDEQYGFYYYFSSLHSVRYQMQIHIKTLLLKCISSSTLHQPNIVNIVESACYIVN
jgi:hypothetical protein